MKSISSAVITVLILSTCLFFVSCNTSSNNQTVLKAGINSPTYPQLLDRSAAIQNGKEWDLVQNTYAKALADLRKQPKKHEAAIKLVEVFINEARVTGEHGHYYPAALKVLNQILASKPTSPDIEFQTKSLKASVLLSQHEFAQALTIAKEAVKLYPYNAGIHGSLTDAYVELGDYKKAVEMADKMVSLRPDLRSYSRVSYLREIHGDMNGAIEAMKLAVMAGYPGYEQTAWARLTLGNLYEQEDMLAEAKAQYQTILQNRPNYAFAIAALASVAEKEGQLEKAEQLLKDACAVIPEVGFYVQLAKLYKNTNRVVASQKLQQEIFTMLQEDVDSGHNMNMEYTEIYLNLGEDCEEALKYALLEYEKRPKNIDVNQLLVKVYRKKGEEEKAKFHLEAANAL